MTERPSEQQLPAAPEKHFDGEMFMRLPILIVLFLTMTSAAAWAETKTICGKVRVDSDGSRYFYKQEGTHWEWDGSANWEMPSYELYWIEARPFKKHASSEVIEAREKAIRALKKGQSVCVRGEFEMDSEYSYIVAEKITFK
jgi:hypothetical protein